MATYSSLKTKVLTLCEADGATDIGAVAQIGLEESLKYVASKVTLPGLRRKTAYTWLSTDDAEVGVSITGVAGFSLSDFQFADRLYVSTTGTNIGLPYDFREYRPYLDLQSNPLGRRAYIFDPYVADDRPGRVYTIDDSNNLLLSPVNTGDKLTLFDVRAPAAYSDGGTPEMPSLFDSILVNGAILYCKEYQRQPTEIVNPYQLLKALDPQIEELSIFLSTQRRSGGIKISPTYRIP